MISSYPPPPPSILLCLTPWHCLPVVYPSQLDHNNFKATNQVLIIIIIVVETASNFEIQVHFVVDRYQKFCILYLAIMSTNCCPHHCAKCNKIQPRNGKIRTCFHIVCPGCAIDSVNAESNSITCSLWEDVTEPLVTGIPLV